MLYDVLAKLGLIKKKNPTIKAKYRLDVWRINHARDGRVWVSGWCEGKYMSSNFIRRVNNGIITDVTGCSYSLVEADGGEWAFDLYTKFPQVFSQLKHGGVPLKLT